jgi:hypothetical protein
VSTSRKPGVLDPRDEWVSLTVLSRTDWVRVGLLSQLSGNRRFTEVEFRGYWNRPSVRQQLELVLLSVGLWRHSIGIGLST